MVRNRIRHIVCVFIINFILSGVSYAQSFFLEKELRSAMVDIQNQDFVSAISHFRNLEPYLDSMDEQSQVMVPYFMGFCYYQMGEYRNALPFYEKVKKSTNDLKIQWDIKPSLLTIYSTLGDSISTSTCLNEMLFLFNDNEFKHSGCHTNYAVALNSYYLESYQYGKALDIAQKGLSVIALSPKSALSEFQKITLLRSSGKSCLKLHDYDQAIAFFKKALSLSSYSSYVDEISESELLTNIGICFDYVDLPDSSRLYYSRAEKIYVEKNVQISRSRIDNALGLGVVLMIADDFKNAQQYLNIAADGYEKLGDKVYQLYAYIYLYDCMKGIGDMEHLSKYSDFIKQYIKSVKVDDGRIAHICYSTYASILALEGDLDAAISVNSDVIAAESHGNIIPKSSLAISYYNQSCLLMKKNDFSHAEKCIQMSLDLLLPIRDKFRLQYVKSAVLFAEILNKTNRLGKAIAWMENLLPTVESLPDNSIFISNYYSYLASLYAEVGNYDRFLACCLLDTKITRDMTGTNSYLYACSLLNLYEAYNLSQEKENAAECLNKAAEIIRNRFGEDSNEYYNIIHKQAVSYTYDSLTKSKGEKVFQKSLLSSKKMFGENSKEHVVDLCWYGLFKLYTSNDKAGLSILQKGTNALLSFEDDTASSFFLSQLYVWCCYLKEYDLAYEVGKKYYANTQRYISINFPYLLDWQRESLWEPLQKNLQGLVSIACETNSPSFLKLVYNSLLLGKGLLLESSNHISNFISQSGDSNLIKTHTQLGTEMNSLLKANNQQESEAIRSNINRLQRQELNLLSEHESFRKQYDIEWCDIQDKLGNDDAAIEFVSFPSQDCISYAALVIDKQSKAPFCVKLFNDKEIEKYSFNDDIAYDYRSSDLYNIIWGNLETYIIKNKKNVYFSPDGLLHKLAIESLCDKNGKLASDKWNLHRLSSTREILNEKKKLKYNTAVLYGGLEHLPGPDIKEETQSEVDEITNIMLESDVKCQVLSDVKGTESSFKALSGSKVNLLHIATHGHYWTKEYKKEYENLLIKPLIDRENRKESALLRSGIMLSGAKTALKGQSLNEDMEDGVLTAKEISTLDFHDLDLVALSACQTGRGEISADGVWGLQRGFKLSGANSIVMSLWNVDNSSTKLLMSEFYRQLLHGNSKVEALKNAQMFVRSHDNYSSR